jgi:hypothetical protein
MPKLPSFAAIPQLGAGWWNSLMVIRREGFKLSTLFHPFYGRQTLFVPYFLVEKFAPERRTTRRIRKIGWMRAGFIQTRQKGGDENQGSQPEMSFTGGYHSAFKGRGMSFSEVRQYRLGDDVRSIDWNVTARTGDPHIKIFEEERELTVLLMVDISGLSALLWLRRRAPPGICH